MFILCDCRTGFILDFLVYTGSQTEIFNKDEFRIPGAVVITLMQPYLQKGHNLFIDSWYTSPALIEYLHENSTGACGTIRQNRVGMPTFIKQLRKGEIDYRHTDILLAVKWLDRREVTILSTIHEPKMVNTGKIDRTTKEQIQKPISVMDYNQNRSAVDRSDMQISCVECARKTIKWYKKLFFHLLNISVLNSYILHKQKIGQTIGFSEFRLQLIREIIETYGESKAPRGRPSTGENPIRLVGRHFPSLIPPTAAKQNAQKQCIVCANTTRRPKKRSDSRYECTECNVGICISDCFKDYHTLKYF